LQRVRAILASRSFRGRNRRHSKARGAAAHPERDRAVSRRRDRAEAGPQLTNRLVAAIWRRPVLVLSVAAMIAIGGGALGSRLALRSSLADLLQSDDPIAKEFDRISNALPGTLMMVIAIEGPDRDANRRAATTFAHELDVLRPALVDTVIGDIRT